MQEQRAQEQVVQGAGRDARMQGIDEKMASVVSDFFCRPLAQLGERPRKREERRYLTGGREREAS
jgi:hypothetical protein